MEKMFHSLRRTIDHSSIFLMISIVLGTLGLIIPEDKYVQFGTKIHEIEELIVSILFLIVPIIIYIHRAIRDYPKSYAIKYVMDPPNRIAHEKFEFRAVRSDLELLTFKRISEEDSGIVGSYHENEIDRYELYKRWRAWRPDAFLALTHVHSRSISYDETLAISIVLPLTSAGIAYFKNGGRARDLDATHISHSKSIVKGLLIDTWAVKSTGYVIVGEQRRTLREHVSRHQNALYLLHMSRFWHSARNITIIYEASNKKLIRPLSKIGFKKLFLWNKENKHYILTLLNSDFTVDTVASLILIYLRRLRSEAIV